MVRCRMFRVNMVFFLLFFGGKKQQDKTLLSQLFIIFQSDQDLCLLTKLMDTVEYMKRHQQSREDPDETVQI